MRRERAHRAGRAAEALGLSRSGWGWDCRLADFDNDGVLEAVQAVGFIRGKINRWPELQSLGTSNSRMVHDPRFWPNFKPGADLSGLRSFAQAHPGVPRAVVADVPERVYKPDSELAHWRRWLSIGTPRFADRAQPTPDLSHPAMAVNLDACIQCTRCVRACREEQVNDVIGLAFRGEHAKIVFDIDDAMGASTCVACGECVQACPTGALFRQGATVAEMQKDRALLNFLVTAREKKQWIV